MRNTALLVLLYGCCFAHLIDRAFSQAIKRLLPDPPTLNGSHFRFTVVEDDGFVNIDKDENGTLTFSGYCIEIIQNISSRANFTFELLPPSGFGTLCNHEGGDVPTEPYGKAYRKQYLCGQ